MVVLENDFLAAGACYSLEGAPLVKAELRFDVEGSRVSFFRPLSNVNVNMISCVPRTHSASLCVPSLRSNRWCLTPALYVRDRFPSTGYSAASSM